MIDPKHDGAASGPMYDRFSESFSDYCQANGIVGDLVPFAEAIYFSGYKTGYEHARLDAGRIMEVEFQRVRNQ